MAAKKKRVLIVEDALDVARLISSALETVDPNLKIMICPSAEEAMLESAHEAVQLLITDIRLPGISGIDMVRKIGSRNPAMKVILITGLSGAQIGRQMDGIQVEGFFRKPFEVTELIEAAERCLNGADGQSVTYPPKQDAPQPPQKKTSAPEELEKALHTLCQDLHALSALLMGPDGAVAAQAGEFPGGAFEQEWAPLIQEALAGQKRLVARLAADAPQSALTFHGKTFDLLIAPVQAYALALAIKPQSSPLRLALALEEAARIRPQLESSLKELPTPEPPAVVKSVEPPAAEQANALAPQAVLPLAVGRKQHPVVEETPVEEPPKAELDGLAALFDSSGAGLKTVDVDAFWESLTETSGGPAGEDSIPFEKARKLGLVSDLGD